ncbi:MAG TPA: D-2-hydroxyacid dehydrogenase [Burkholderiales bacterium]|nr:D-2-hydroxyacid dehydrogenase [Burkholderiales bacterium]
MTTALVSKPFIAQFGDAFKAIGERAGKSVNFMTLPEAKGTRLSQADCDRIDCAFLDRDMRFDEQIYAAYSDALPKMNHLKWVHYTSSGIGQQLYVSELNAKGVITTSSTGSNAEPVAQTGFAGLMMLARCLPHHIQSQHRHEWRPLRGAALPDDLRGQTLLLIGVGAVGKTFAGYARAFGLNIIGVRRSPKAPGDPVDEMHPPSQLPDLLPRADWIVIACPLTPETDNLLNADAFKRIKKGARLINIGRGEVVNDAALIESLRSGHLGGAALDAHIQEPLPKDSPLWDLPNVIITPHNASASTGNEKRSADMFVANFGHWVRGEPLFNVQRV